MNRNILIAILAVVVIAAVGAFFLTQPATTTDGKQNTQINFLSEAVLHNGEVLQFELKDLSGHPIAGQNITINYDDGTGNVQTYKVITDQNGKGFLAISGEAAGKYDVTITYGGNDQYNGCSAKLSITVEDGAVQTSSQSTESNSTANTVMYNNETSSNSTGTTTSGASQTYYDADLNVYYDSNGVVIGGQSDGANIYDLRNFPPEISEDGSLV